MKISAEYIHWNAKRQRWLCRFCLGVMGKPGRSNPTVASCREWAEEQVMAMEQWQGLEGWFDFKRG